MEFYDTNAKGEKVLNFKRLLRENEENFTHNLQLSLYTKDFNNCRYYYLIIEETDQIEELKEKNQSNARLLSSICHELKTPLNGSLPMLESLREDPNINEKIKVPFLVNSICSLKLLDNSLSNILDFYLFSSNQFISNPIKFKLKDFLYEIVSIIQPQCKIKNLEINIEVDPLIHNSTIYSDYNRLKQIALNLLLNAIQFTYSGHITLKIERVENKPLILKFTISDTGIGFEWSKLEKIKQKFKDGKDDLHLNSTGYCLGITLSNKLALLLGGVELEIDSKEKKVAQSGFLF